MGELGQQTILDQCSSCSFAVASIRDRHLTEDHHLRMIRNWKNIDVKTVFYLPFILLVSVKRLFAKIITFYLLFITVFHFNFLRESMPDIDRFTVEWCKVIIRWRRVPLDVKTSLKEARMLLQHLQNSINVHILKCVTYCRVFLSKFVKSLGRKAWLRMTEGCGIFLHCKDSKHTVDRSNKSRIPNNRNCNQRRKGLVCRTNRVAAMCISSLKDPFRFSFFKVTTLLLMLRPSPITCMAAYKDESPYPSDYGSERSTYDFFEPPQPMFGVEPGYKYSYNTKLPDKIMTEGVIICLLAGTAFVGLVVWLAKTNFKESQQRRMRREASLRDRTLLVQSEDDIV